MGSYHNKLVVVGLVATCALTSACGARVAPYLGGQPAAGIGGGPAAGNGSGAPGAAPTGDGAASGLAESAGGGGTSTSAVPGQAASGQAATPGSGGAGAAGPGASPVPSSGPAQAGASGVAASRSTPATPGAMALGASPTGANPSPTGAAVEQGGPAAFSFDPAAEAGACRGTAGNTASATGVTASSITFGNVSGLTGVLANNFNQAPQAVQALFSSINAHGGICGRRLILRTEDDGQDASRNAADVADLIPNVLAFVGSSSDADNGGVAEMVQANIPDVGFAVNPDRSESPVYWSAGGSSGYQRNGVPYQYDALEEALVSRHQAPKRLALLSYSVPISVYGTQTTGYMFAHHAGTTICFTDESVSPATASLDQDVLQMEANHCDGIFSGMDVTGNAKLLEALQRQGFHPPFVGTFGDGYTDTLIDLAGQQAAQGFQVNTNFVPFDDPNPVMQLYRSQLALYEPGQQPGFFGALSYSSAQMLVEALVHAGRAPTRAKLVSFFESLDGFSAGGMVGPSTPRLRFPPGPCLVELSVQGNHFARLFPHQGYDCVGSLVPAGP